MRVASQPSTRAETEDAFLDAAERLLIGLGYAGISTRRLAEEAGANEAPDPGSSKPFPVARPAWPHYSLILPVSLAVSGLVIALTYLLAVATPGRRRPATA